MIRHIKYTLTALFTLSIFSLLGTASAATGKLVSGVPIVTFCSTYAKDVATKSVAIGLIVKIKDNPLLKTSLMRQYSTFIALGKQYCIGSYAPGVISFQSTPSSTTTNTSTDISQNKPIIVTSVGRFTELNDYFTGYDTVQLSGLTDQQLYIVHERIEKAKVVYGDVVNMLIGYGWLQAKDRDQMVGKIAFKFSQNCSQLDGKILVRQRYDSNRNPTATELVNLFVTINLCFTQSYSNNFGVVLDRIITHELGHYYNYFYDINSEGFTSICWSGMQNICPPDDFISTYAPTSPDEDYAETFSYYVNDNRPIDDRPRLKQKIDYFKAKYPR